MGVEAELEHGIAEVEPLLSAVGIALPSKAEAEREAAEIALTWASTFGATFLVMAKPALHAGSLGDSKTIIVSAAVAGGAAAVRACKPLLLKAVRGLKKSAAAPAPAVAASAPYSAPPAA